MMRVSRWIVKEDEKTEMRDERGEERREEEEEESVVVDSEDIISLSLSSRHLLTSFHPFPSLLHSPY